MRERRVIRNARSGTVVLGRAIWCASFFCRFRGLMFRRSLPQDEGLLFVFGKESVGATSIHMFFVGFPIAAEWLDAGGTVVDARLARPWRPYYAPARPAKYLIEAGPDLLERVQVGDRLTFDEVAG